MESNSYLNIRPSQIRSSIYLNPETLGFHKFYIVAIYPPKPWVM